MEIGTTDTLAALYGDALDFAQNLDESLSSFHFLLSFFTTPSEVTVLFEDLDISERLITDIYKALKRRYLKEGTSLDEPEGILASIEARAATFLQNTHDEVAPLHLLLGMIGEKKSIAYHLLEETGRLGDLRLRAMSILTNPPRRVRNRIMELLEETALIQSLPESRSHDPARESESGLFPSASVATDVASRVEIPERQSLPDVFRQFGRDLTALAREGVLDPICGRDREIEGILDILGRRRSNNPLLVGPPGVGKTAIVEGLAYRQRDGLLADRIIWEFNLSALVAGTEYRGTLEKRITTLIAEVERLKNTLIVFIDEIHLLCSESHEMIADILKPVLARGGFPLIGATTPDEFKRFVSRDPAMERRFTIVPIEEPTGDTLHAIALTAARSLSAYHRVRLDIPQFIKAAIDLSNRYLSGQSQPDKVLSLLDTLGSVLHRTGKKEAQTHDLLEFIAARSGIPVEHLLVDGSAILRTLPPYLDTAIKGQASAKERVTRLLARRFARKETRHPLASLIFAGPTGVGKSTMARALASYFFGSEKRMVSFDMGEFQEMHTLARLVGAPPGYTGYEEGGVLTEAFRREPYQLLLFNEIDKAHPNVLFLLLHLLEEGRLSDNRGFSVSFSQAIVVMTVNIDAGENTGSRLGFESETVPASAEQVVRDALKKSLPSEFLNRVDEIVPFTYFSVGELQEVCSHLLSLIHI